MRWILPRILVVVFGLGVCACGDVELGRLPDDGSHSIRLMTFNTALGAGLAPYTDQRRDALAAVLPTVDTDILCLQEIWSYSDVEGLKAALTDEYPYTFQSVQPVEEGATSCTVTETELLSTCLQQNCGQAAASDLLLCAVLECDEAFAEVSEGCQQCIVANQQTPPADLLSLCSGGEALGFEEQNGLLILSRLPLIETEFLSLQSSLGDRGVLMATVQPSASPGIDVYCTHLAASIGAELYSGSLGSWQQERFAQAGAVLEWIGGTSSESTDVAVLGDLNCGPETDEVPPEDPASFELFAQAGFVSPYLELGQSSCTWCADNPLVDTEGEALLDHILWRSVARRPLLQSVRILDQQISVEVDGESLNTHLSDHYGVLVDVAYAVESE